MLILATLLFILASWAALAAVVAVGADAVESGCRIPAVGSDLVDAEEA